MSVKKLPAGDGVPETTIVDEGQLAARMDKLDEAVGTALEKINAELSELRKLYEENVSKDAANAIKSKPAPGANTEIDERLKKLEACEDYGDRVEKLEGQMKQALDNQNPMTSTIGPRGVP